MCLMTYVSYVTYVFYDLNVTNVSLSNGFKANFLHHIIVLYNDVHDISIFFKGTGKFILMTILKKLVP